MTDPTPDTLFALYHSGAFLCLGIVAAYLALKYASTRVAWLEVPGRAHYVTAGLGALALLVMPATQGTTPNASMIFAAVGTLVALLLPGAPASVKAPQSGRVTPRLLVMLAAVGFALMACGASARHKVISATFNAADATAAQLATYSAEHEANIVKTATTKDVAVAELTSFRTKVDTAVKVIDSVYRAVAAAAIADDDQSVAAMLQVAALGKAAYDEVRK